MLVIDGSVQGQSVHLSFLVADDSDLIFKGHIFLNIPADKLLHCFKRAVYGNRFRELADLKIKDGDLILTDGILCLLRLKTYLLKAETIAVVKAFFCVVALDNLDNIRH